MIYSDKDLTLMTHYINIENILHQKPLADKLAQTAL
jgi:hypothetical protein